MNSDNAIQHIGISLAFFAIVALSGCAARGSQPASTSIAASPRDVKNVGWAVGGAKALDASSRVLGRAREIVPGLVVSNGMYSLDIEMEAPAEELIPESTSPGCISLRQMLGVYARLIGAQLQLEEDVELEMDPANG